jgi:hypothetical protein
MDQQGGWVGIDFDGTLVEHYEGQDPHVIGKPIPLMVRRVKRWIAQGKDVRIFTARVNPRVGKDAAEYAENARRSIERWCFRHLGKILPATHEKDYLMIEYFDDRAVQMIPNTGVRVDGKRDECECDGIGSFLGGGK